MTTAKRFTTVAAAAVAVVSATAVPNGLSPADLARASLPKPLASSHVIGDDAQGIFKAMNTFLEQQEYTTKACEDHSHMELNRLAEILFDFRNEDLANMYKVAHDKRQFHFDEFHYKTDMWAQETRMQKAEPQQYGPGSKHYSMVRDGKCAELVMWWIHHLPQAARDKLAAVEGFAVPLLPAKGLVGQELDQVNEEYVYQVSCSDCHSTGRNSDSSGHHEPVPRRNKAPINGVPAGTCPIDNSSGLPSVWYRPMSDVGNRKKRCDWDYDPPCGLCEGIGGYSWGDQEGDITYTSCEPIALPADIPAGTETSSVWPEAFEVDEVTTLINQKNTGGRFPGADPCADHKFTNDTETQYYDGSLTNFPGPIMYTKASTTAIYTLPDANMFIKILGAFCICVTPRENSVSNATKTGALRFDFASDAVLIGRERIGLEGTGLKVVADHYGKGPHHFWIDVETGLYVRGWQPWNGLNVYVPGTWKIGAPEAALFDVPKSCYDGVLHRNISCTRPYPDMIPL